MVRALFSSVPHATLVVVATTAYPVGIGEMAQTVSCSPGTLMRRALFSPVPHAGLVSIATTTYPVGIGEEEQIVWSVIFTLTGWVGLLRFAAPVPR